MPQVISVLDSTGATQSVSLPTTAADNGRAAAAASRPVALSTEDLAAINALTAKMEEVRALINGTDSQLPATLGQKTAANSLSTVLASDAGLPLPTGAATQATLASIDADIGAPTTAAAAADGTGDYPVIGGIKRLALGMAEALANWTTLLARIPAKGQAAMAASLPVAIASNQTALQTVEPALLLTGAAAQTAVVNNILEAAAGSAGTDLANYRTASVQVVSTGTGGTFIFEQSADNVNWAALPVFNAALVTGVPITAAITATASAIIYTFPVRARYVRLRIATTITGGSIQAFSRISTEPWTAAAQLVASNTAANLNATVSGTVTASNAAGTAAQGAAASGNPVFVGGVAKTAQPTARTDGQMVAELFDKVGRGVIRQGQVRDLTDLNAQVALTGTPETTLVAAVAATFNDLQALEIASTAAFSGTPTGVRLDFRDVAAGTVRFSVSLPAAGGSFNWNRSWMGSELKQATVNTAWTVQLVFVGGTAPAVSSGDIRITPQSIRNI